MPLYEFLCIECNNTGEAHVSLSRLEEDVVVCVDCGRQAMRVISGAKGGDSSDYNRRKYPCYIEALNQHFSSSAQEKKYLKANGISAVPDGVHGIKKEVRRQYFT